MTSGDAFLEDLISDSDDELPVGWEMRVTDDGRVFYVDHSGKCTQWGHPKTSREKKLSPDLPFGWQKGVTEDGSPIFVDQVNKRTTCVDPRIAYATTSKNKGRMKYDANSSAMAVIRGKNMHGKIALITGGTSGIGFETARALSLHGCHVILACRDVSKGKQAAEKIRKDQSIDVHIDVVECDLSSLTSVELCAKKVINKKWCINILICNAGIFGLPFTLTEDGIEATFATNHLGHFYLIDLLKDVLIASQPSRVVVVSGESHRYPTLYDEEFTIDNISSNESSYYACVAYNQSKLCNLLFAFELNRRLSAYGVYCNAVHPGNLIATKLMRHSYVYQFLLKFIQPFAKSKEQGAATTIYCATSDELERIGGYYFNNCCGCEPSKLASDEELARKLWLRSEMFIRNRKNPRDNSLGFI